MASKKIKIEGSKEKGVQGEGGRRIIEGVIRTFFQHGGEHIQINVVDNKTLLAAQAQGKTIGGPAKITPDVALDSE